MSFTVSQTREDDQATVLVAGELDIYTAPELDDVITELVDGGVQRIVVDMNGLEFLDSSGLSVILAAHQRLAGAGGSLTLEGPSQYIVKMFDITGLTQYFEIKVSPKQA